MQLKDTMAENVTLASLEDTVATAAQSMREANIGCLVVVNSEALLGIVTDRDLLIGCLGDAHAPGQCRVSSHMSTPLITAGPDMDVMDAAHMMFSRKIKRLPIIEGDRLVGLMSLSDIGHTLG